MWKKTQICITVNPCAQYLYNSLMFSCKRLDLYLLEIIFKGLIIFLI